MSDVVIIDLLIILIAVALYYLGRWEGWSLARAQCDCGPDDDTDEDPDLPTCPPDPSGLFDLEDAR